jgi:flavin reductase (DIM6/NTAB) family NADH-FMN oxidoreductase RutF
MTISWGQVGFVWSRRIFTVFVRRSHCTHACLRTADSSTVNVPALDRLAEERSFCGTRSGRQTDTLKACSLRTNPGECVSAQYLRDCDLHYECRIVARTQLTLPDVRADDVIAGHYPKDNLHLLVLGEIAGAYVRGNC